MLAPMGEANVWETDYVQRLAPVQEGHPVRHFTQSTAMRPIVNKLDEAELKCFISTYEEALNGHYPPENDGSVLFPFKRVFFTLVV